MNFDCHVNFAFQPEPWTPKVLLNIDDIADASRELFDVLITCNCIVFIAHNELPNELVNPLEKRIDFRFDLVQCDFACEENL